MARSMEIVTPLGEDLLFHRMSAREELGRLSEYEIDLLSKRKDIDIDKILGQNVTVKLELPKNKVRHFNGFVTHFSQAGMHGRYNHYHASVRPWLWFLTRRANCRMFQEMKAPDIVKEIFDDHGITDVKFSLNGSYRTREYCVQYRETDFNFVSRLMEQEGIYYYFTHADGRHTMVVTDGTHSKLEDLEEISFVPLDRLRPGQQAISDWRVERAHLATRFAIDDFYFEGPSVERLSKTKITRKHNLADYEVYDYPGLYVTPSEGEHYVPTRQEAAHARFELANGTGNVRGMAAGGLFKLTGHPRDDQKAEYLVVGTNHYLEYSEYEAMAGGGADYHCAFLVMNTREPFRAEESTPKPIVKGPQTAIVVGPSGDEIYTDKYGRVKVQFHWDREGENNENSSCWIRVSHPWAGKNWGMVATPRIGQEVIVDFLEGDPDRPIITGRVYNAEQRPPFGFPAGAVISGIKSDTHKGSGYNELSMDDTAGKEKITIHGQYDMNSTIEHDQTLTVHNNRTDRIDVDDSESVGNNQKWDVGVNRDAKIGSNETLTIGANRTKSVGANESVTIGGNRSATVSGSETATVAVQRTHSVGANETISVGAAQEITIGGLQALTVGAVQTVNVGANQSTSVGANQTINVASNQTTSAGGNVGISAGSKFGASAGSDFSGSAGGKMGLKAGGDLGVESGGKASISAASELTLVCGGASIVLKSGGQIQIKGTDIVIDGSGKISVKAGGDVVLKGSKIDQN